MKNVAALSLLMPVPSSAFSCPGAALVGSLCLQTPQQMGSRVQQLQLWLPAVKQVHSMVHSYHTDMPLCNLK